MTETSQPSSPTDTPTTTTSGQKKRSRATAEQLAILEDTFAVNVSPNSKLRAQLSARLNMTERSIQIWFQNRRAKVKHLQKKAEIQAQEDAIKSSSLYHRHSLTPGYYPRSAMAYHRPSLPPRMTFPRSYSTDMSSAYAMRPDMTPSPYNVPGWAPVWPADSNRMTPHTLQNYSAVPHPPSQDHLSRTATPISVDDGSYRLAFMSEPPNPHDVALALGNHSQSMGPELPTEVTSSPATVNTLGSTTALPPALALSGQPFTAFSLTIGTWHRMKLQQADLLCSFDLSERTLSWHISDSGHCFKAEFSFDNVTSIKYNLCEDGVSALMTVELSHPPMFFMDSNDMGTISWIQCSDFTENTQASQCLQHTVKGVAQSLRQELLAIITADKRLEDITQMMPPGMPYLDTTIYQTAAAPPNFPTTSASLSAPEYAWPGYTADPALAHPFGNVNT